MKHLFKTINEAVTDDMPEMSAPLIEIIGEFGLEQPYDNSWLTSKIGGFLNTI